MKEQRDYTLETLIDMNGYIIEVGGGCWVKIEARRVEADLNKPSGVKYSLTLHDFKGERILGYDNAHRVPPLSSKSPHDHIHKGEAARSYDYKDAASLLEDFWKDVDRIVEKRT